MHERDNAHSIGELPPIGMLAGNGPFPLIFAEQAKKHGRRIAAVCFEGEADPRLSEIAESTAWIKMGELNKLISSYKEMGVKEAVMAGGVKRTQMFGNVKLDARAAAMVFRLRSTKDDVLMRGLAEELGKEGIEIVPCTTFLEDLLVEEGVLTESGPSREERRDIEVGREAIRAMGDQHIGQLVVVREGVIVAVEAVEGSDAAILRGGELGGRGTVVVKCAKPSQDMRFDVPTTGLGTIQTMLKAQARVLALEAKRCLILDKEEVIEKANQSGIAIVGCPRIDVRPQ